jgi:hypothetical protein
MTETPPPCPWPMVSACSYLEPTLGTLTCAAQGLQYLKLDNTLTLDSVNQNPRHKRCMYGM